MKRSMKNIYYATVMVCASLPMMAGLLAGEDLGSMMRRNREAWAKHDAWVAAQQTAQQASSSSVATTTQPKPTPAQPAVVPAKKPTYVWPMAGAGIVGTMAYLVKRIMTRK